MHNCFSLLSYKPRSCHKCRLGKVFFRIVSLKFEIDVVKNAISCHVKSCGPFTLFLKNHLLPDFCDTGNDRKPNLYTVHSKQFISLGAWSNVKPRNIYTC